jgi:histidinol dehydrogenase
LITNCQSAAEKSPSEVERLLKILPTAALAFTSWGHFVETLAVHSLDEAYKLADNSASEHVQIVTQEPRQVLEKMRHYGALFFGEKSSVSYGDTVCSVIPSQTSLIAYCLLQCIGTHHVLQTKELPASGVVYGSRNIQRHARIGK